MDIKFDIEYLKRVIKELEENNINAIKIPTRYWNEEEMIWVVIQKNELIKEEL